MVDGLAGGFAVVDAYVVAVGVVLLIEQLLDRIDQVDQGDLLVAGGVEPRGDFFLRDDQCVALGDGVVVVDGERVVVFGDPVGCWYFCER